MALVGREWPQEWPHEARARAGAFLPYRDVGLVVAVGDASSAAQCQRALKDTRRLDRGLLFEEAL